MLDTDQLNDVVRMRDSIRSTVLAWGRGAGRGFRRASPWAIVGTLVAAAIAPVVWPLAGAAGVSAAVLGALAGQVGNVGAGYLAEVAINALERVRQVSAGESSPAQLREVIEDELWVLTDSKEGALGLRREMAALLRGVGGIDIAVSAAVETGVEEIQEALLAAFTDLGGSVAEFAWMLEETCQAMIKIQAEQARQSVEQRYQTDLARETLAKTNLVIQRLEVFIGVASGRDTDEKQTGLSDPPDEQPAPGPCPYMGLLPFRPEDAQWYFGREQLIAELVSLLVEAPILAVVGASGVGKSSLLEAGLLPRVWAGTVPGASPWTTLAFKPTKCPLQELASQVALRLKLPAGGFLADLRADPENLRLAIRQVLADSPTGTRILLVIDQLEEVFTLCGDDAERRGFLHALAALTEPNCGVTVVLGIRADFYQRCANHPPLAAALQDHQLLVTPMNAEELRAAITRPAERAGLHLESGLVETILADLGEEPGSLPLLSHALSATWERRQGRTLTHAGYRDAGGCAKAIGQTADAVYGALEPTQQLITKDIFLRLTALGEGTEDTRRRVHPSELASREDSIDVQGVLNALAAHRLITLGENSIEVAHEALIREWPQLREWLNEDRDGRRVARGLTTAAQDWTTSGRDKDLLYRGARLDDVRAWVQRTQARLSEDEDEFLITSIRTQEQEEQATQRRTRRLRQLVASLAVALLLVITTTVFFVKERNNAVQGQNLGISRKVAGDAISLRITEPALAAQLALAAFRLVLTAEARGALISTLGPLDGNRQLRAETGDAVRSVAFSPNGHLLAAASQDGFAYLWELTDPPNFGNAIVRLSHAGQVRSVAFRSDGLILATASRDKTAKLWDITDPRHPTNVATLDGHVNGHVNSVVGVAFSPDGHTLATASDDHHVKLWNITNPRDPSELATLYGHDREVAAVAFSPDGRTLATASYDKTAKLWNIANPSNPTELATLARGAGFVDSVAFSPNGHVLATAHHDTTARLWDITDPRNPTRLAVLAGHTGPVYSVTFSPDGSTVATTSNDTTIRLWDVTNPRSVTEWAAPFVGHTDNVYSAAFTPDGHTLATASHDTSVRLWEIDVNRLATRICEIAHPAITRTEWDQYFPDLPYNPPCP